MEIKILSSLAKVFPDEICGDTEIKEISCLKNEKTSFQIAVKTDYEGKINISVKENKEYITPYFIKFVPAKKAAPDDHDDYFIRGGKPGDYPDVLIPLDSDIRVKKGEWISFWFEFSPLGKLKAGEHQIKAEVSTEKETREINLTACIADASFGEQSLICTHWFHSDCLASYYKTEVFSEEHWRIIESFMKTAVSHGVNTILTPLFTPPLDTEKGGERPTVQLIGVKKRGSVYTFSFDRLDRWIETAERCGMKYFEMSHLFTQWGARKAPKIMADTEEGYKKIFGWETRAGSRSYKDFLMQLAPKLTAYINEKGLHDRVMFHTSDEPNMSCYLPYRKASKLMNRLFGDFKIVDALSDFTFYKTGVVKNPIPGIEKIDTFYGKVPELWTYYCCLPYKENLPNRFNAMPSMRSRILGIIMYIYGVKGFLHWGYNFYYTRFSKREVDPFTETDAGAEFSSGDSFVVYPAKDGSPYVSLRFKVFYEAVQDYEALMLLEKKMKREDIIEFLQKGLEKPITAREYPHSEEWLLEKRKEINKMLGELYG